jgi:hypothetical protein
MKTVPTFHPEWPLPFTPLPSKHSLYALVSSVGTRKIYVRTCPFPSMMPMTQPPRSSGTSAMRMTIQDRFPNSTTSLVLVLRPTAAFTAVVLGHVLHYLRLRSAEHF